MRRFAARLMADRSRLLRALLAWLLMVTCVGAIILSISVVAIPQMSTGEVAPVTVQADRTVDVVDERATSAARQSAWQHTPPVLVFHPFIATQSQIAGQRLMDSIAIIRRTMPAVPQRLAALRRLLPANQDAQLVPTLALLDAASWQVVSGTLLAQLQQATLTPYTTAQVAARVRQVTLTAVPDPASATQVLHALMTLALRPNTTVDPVATLQARQHAEGLVVPVLRVVQQGQVIVRAGDLLSPAAVQEVDAVRQRTAPTWSVLWGVLLLSLALVGLCGAYTAVTLPHIASSPRLVLLITAIVTVVLGSARLAIISHQAYADAFPIGVATLLTAVLLDGNLAVLIGVLTSIIAGMMMPDMMQMMVMYLVSSVAGSLMLRRVRRLNQFLLAGIAIVIVQSLVLLAFWLLGQQSVVSLGTSLASAVLNGGLCATLALGSFGLLGYLFDVTTALQLLELSHPDHPLLRRLMLNAPGTYHHSLMIGNLAERAAEQIGGDPLLARVCAYYHDIGKLCSPTSFAENQLVSGNIHDTLPPEESTRVILQHVSDGLRLARQYHLPRVIQDGIAEHHGSTLVAYFYNRAQTTHPDHVIDPRAFSYPGPRPHSRETAILMLADGVEAIARTIDTTDASALRAAVQRIIQQRLRDGQLDDSPLTLRDLSTIADSFVTVLSGVSHHRVLYPEQQPQVQQPQRSHDEPSLGHV